MKVTQVAAIVNKQMAFRDNIILLNYRTKYALELVDLSSLVFITD